VGCGEVRHLLDARGLEVEGVMDSQICGFRGRGGCIPWKNEESFSCNVRSKIDVIWTEQCRFRQCVDRRAEMKRHKVDTAKLLEGCRRGQTRSNWNAGSGPELYNYIDVFSSPGIWCFAASILAGLFFVKINFSMSFCSLVGVYQLNQLSLILNLEPPLFV